MGNGSILEYDHQNTKMLISAFVDNELNWEDKANIEEHLNFCPDCQNDLKKIATLKQLLNHCKDSFKKGPPFANKL
jgi:predicted anti-sigma-YlaC factor YlaD